MVGSRICVPNCGLRLILVLLAEPGCEPKHQLHPLDLVYPIAEIGIEFCFLGRHDAGRAKRPQFADHQGAIAMDRTVS